MMQISATVDLVFKVSVVIDPAKPGPVSVRIPLPRFVPCTFIEQADLEYRDQGLKYFGWELERSRLKFT